MRQERKKRKAIGNKGDESKENDIKVIIRFQTPCALNPLRVSEAVYKLVERYIQSKL